MPATTRPFPLTIGTPRRPPRRPGTIRQDAHDSGQMIAQRNHSAARQCEIRRYERPGDRVWWLSKCAELGVLRLWAAVVVLGRDGAAQCHLA
jgi:hypothetical protein